MPLDSEQHPIYALVEHCLSVRQRPTMGDILAEFRHMKVIFPGSDELPMETPEPIVGPIQALPALEIAERLQSLSARDLVELGNSVVGSPDGGLGFMDGCLAVAEYDESAEVRCCALVELLQLLARHTELVDEFVAAKLHEKINLERPEMLKEALSLFIHIASIHPEVVMHQPIISCLRLQPHKVLRFFSVVSQFFSNESFDWDFVDALFLNADFLISENAGCILLSILYSLISRYSVFRIERSRSCIDFFTLCLHCGDEAVISKMYPILTSVRLGEIKEPGLLVEHFSNPRIRPAVLRFLTIADLQNLPIEFVHELICAEESKLAVALLWRFASIQKFVPQILKCKLSQFAPSDVLKLVMVIAGEASNRETIATLEFVPSVLKNVVKMGEVELLSVICQLIRRLPIDRIFFRTLERIGFIDAFLKQVMRLDCHKLGYLLVDRLLRLRFSPSFLIFLPVLVRNITAEPALQISTLSLLVLYSAYTQTHQKLNELRLMATLEAIDITLENHQLLMKLLRNLKEWSDERNLV